MKDGHSAPDLWHLTIDDLLTPPPETPRLGGSGPFVINLSASTAPISIPTEGFPGLEQLRVYQVKRTENNRWRFRLRVGLINTELEADAILAVVRERYPSAFTATAGDDDQRAVSEASRTAQAKRAHATEMIADEPEEDAEPPKAAAPKPAAPIAQAPPVTRWVIMQAPEKKTPPPHEEKDVDPNAVTDQVAILKLPNDEAAAELVLDDVVPPRPVVPPKAELPKKAEPPKAAVPPTELRPLLEPTRKTAPTPATVGDLQAIADLVVIDHEDTLESVVLKSNAMVDSLHARVDVAPQGVPTVTETVATRAAPSVDAPVATSKPALEVAAPLGAAIDLVPELTVEMTDLAIPVVAKARTTVAESPKRVSEPTARVSAPPAKAKVSEPPKVVEPPVLTATVNEPQAKAIEPKKFVELSALTAKVIEPPVKAAEAAKAVEPPRSVKVQLVAGGAAQAVRAASKSHRAIAKQAKAAAKQSKALNRTSKEIAKATKTSTHSTKATLHPPKVAEQTKPAVQAPPPTPGAPPPKAEHHPAKPEHHPVKPAPRPTKNAAHPLKSSSPPPKTSHPPRTSHAVMNGQAPKVNGSSHKLNGHAPAPRASLPAPNGRAHALVRQAPAQHGYTQAPNGHAPVSKDHVLIANIAVGAPVPPAPAVVAQPIAPVAEPAQQGAPLPKRIEILSEPLPPMDSTQTIRALTPLELADDDGSHWYSIQLSLSEDEVNPETVPHLDIFDEYRLYSVAGLDQDRFLHALRLGFFTDEGAAQAVAGYLKCFFEEPSVKRVSIAERERFAERRVVARKDIGATSTHTIIELATAPPVPETTLADLSQSAIRRMPENESLLSRLFAQLKR